MLLYGHGQTLNPTEFSAAGRDPLNAMERLQRLLQTHYPVTYESALTEDKVHPPDYVPPDLNYYDLVMLQGKVPMTHLDTHNMLRYYTKRINFNEVDLLGAILVIRKLETMLTAGDALCTICGNQGSWTNSDDVRRSRMVRKAAPAVRRVVGRVVNNLIKRQTGINVSKLARSTRRRRPRRNRNVAFAATAIAQSSGQPRISRGEQGVTISHREFIANINGSDPYTVQIQENINPANATLFPWLATQANSWEKYQFTSLRFEFITRSPTDKAGSVLLVPIYDPSMHAPTSEAQATSFRGAVEDAPWKGMSCVFKPQQLAGLRFVSYYLQAGDIRTADVGKFVLATMGMDNTNMVGKLWVSYTVKLLSPLTSGPSPQCHAYTQLKLANTYEVSTVGTDKYFAVKYESYTHDGLGIAKYGFGGAGNIELNLPAGAFMFSLSIPACSLAHEGVGNKTLEFRYTGTSTTILQNANLESMTMELNHEYTLSFADVILVLDTPGTVTFRARTVTADNPILVTQSATRRVLTIRAA